MLYALYLIRKNRKEMAEYVKAAVVNPMIEINMLIPDSILFGSLLFYFLTQNVAFGVFGIFIFENVISHRLISWGLTGIENPPRPPLQCRVGFKTARPAVERIFSHGSYPSYGVFSIASIAAYLGSATKEFGCTMDTMGDSWPVRKMVAYLFIGIFIIAFLAGRYISGCDTVSEMVVSLVLGAFVGLLFYRINYYLFGAEAMNFLGLPNMVTKESDGTPIYVCSSDKPNKA